MTTNILILCTHNAARSVLAEGMLNTLAARSGKDVRAYSAGSAPAGRVHPLALDVLREAGVACETLRSKSWDEFSVAGAPAMRAVITVCDAAAAEACPVWPGSPVRVHWAYPDPSRVSEEAAQRAAFELTRQAIGYRMLQLLQLPFEGLSDAELRAAMNEIAAR